MALIFSTPSWTPPGSIKTPFLSYSSSIAARRLSASLPLKTSNKFRSMVFSTDCSVSFS